MTAAAPYPVPEDACPGATATSGALPPACSPATAAKATSGHPVRAVLVDDPAAPLVLTVYGDAGRLATVELEPLRALALAGELVDAARRRMREAQDGR